MISISQGLLLFLSFKIENQFEKSEIIENYEKISDELQNFRTFKKIC